MDDCSVRNIKKSHDDAICVLWSHRITTLNWLRRGPRPNPFSIPPLPTTTHRRHSRPPELSSEEGRSFSTSLRFFCIPMKPNGGGYLNISSFKIVFLYKNGCATGVDLEWSALVLCRAKEGLHSLLSTSWTYVRTRCERKHVIKISQTELKIYHVVYLMIESAVFDQTDIQFSIRIQKHSSLLLRYIKQQPLHM